MNSWIFTVTVAKSGKRIMDALDVYRNRMEDAFWGIAPGVSNTRRINVDDQVIFYLAGKNGKKFLGSAFLSSKFQKLTKTDYERTIHPPFLNAKFGVFLRDIDVWDEQISIVPLLDKLTLTKGETNWGLKVHNSIIPLLPEDYEKIVGTSVYAELEKHSLEEPKLLNEEKKNYTNSRKKALDVAFQREVRKNYEFTCAICGKKRANRLGHYEVQSCHIYPREKNGSNDFRNGLAMCRFHHWAFDNGLFAIKNDYTISVEDRIKGKSDYEEIERYDNKKITLPKNEKFNPHQTFLQAHRKLHKFN